MACGRFSFHRTNVRRLAGTLQNGGAKQTWPASSLQVAGRCCERNSEQMETVVRDRLSALALGRAPRTPLRTADTTMVRTAQVRVKPRSKSLRGYCCAATALSFADCLSERVFPSPGMSLDEFIDDGKRVAKFGAVISSEESAASNSRCRKPSVCCVLSARARQMET